MIIDIPIKVVDFPIIVLKQLLHIVFSAIILHKSRPESFRRFRKTPTSHGLFAEIKFHELEIAQAGLPGPSAQTNCVREKTPRHPVVNRIGHSAIGFLVETDGRRSGVGVRTKHRLVCQTGRENDQRRGQSTMV